MKLHILFSVIPKFLRLISEMCHSDWQTDNVTYTSAHSLLIKFLWKTPTLKYRSFLQNSFHVKNKPTVTLLKVRQTILRILQKKKTKIKDVRNWFVSGFYKAFAEWHNTKQWQCFDIYISCKLLQTLNFVRCELRSNACSWMYFGFVSATAFSCCWQIVKQGFETKMISFSRFIKMGQG